MSLCAGFRRLPAREVCIEGLERVRWPALCTARIGAPAESRARPMAHRHYSLDYTPLHVAEAAWKYSRRNDDNPPVSYLRRQFA